jgi:Flp pilus assembly protein protease CpaA
MEQPVKIPCVTFVALILFLALAGLSVEGQVNYVVSGSTASVANSPNASGGIVISNSYEGYPVTGIGGDAFYGCTLTNVVIGTNVTSIGGGAFAFCGNLPSVTLPNSVTNIGFEAFFGCTSLTNIAATVGNPAYSSTNGVLFNSNQTTVILCPPGVGNYIIPNRASSIGDDAFYGCTLLTNVVIGTNVTSLGDNAFANCYKLPSITIPKSVTNIVNDAFLESVLLTNITVTVGNPAYSSTNGVLFNSNQTTLILCPAGVGNYVIPNSVTNIGDHAFYVCGVLTNVVIDTNVTSIGDYAFASCYDLTSIIVPNRVTSIGVDMFAGCSSLTSVVIGTNVTSVGDDAFYACSLLTSVTIPNSVTNIGEAAFEGCSSLASAVIGANVASIGDQAFQDCYDLTSITIPNRVTSIGDAAFEDCSSLTNAVIGTNVTSIGLEMFYFTVFLEQFIFITGRAVGARLIAVCRRWNWACHRKSSAAARAFTPAISASPSLASPIKPSLSQPARI